MKHRDGARREAEKRRLGESGNGQIRAHHRRGGVASACGIHVRGGLDRSLESPRAWRLWRSFRPGAGPPRQRRRAASYSPSSCVFQAGAASLRAIGASGRPRVSRSRCPTYLLAVAQAAGGLCLVGPEADSPSWHRACERTGRFGARRDARSQSRAATAANAAGAPELAAQLALLSLGSIEERGAAPHGRAHPAPWGSSRIRKAGGEPACFGYHVPGGLVLVGSSPRRPRSAHARSARLSPKLRGVVVGLALAVSLGVGHRHSCCPLGERMIASLARAPEAVGDGKGSLPSNADPQAGRRNWSSCQDGTGASSRSARPPSGSWYVNSAVLSSHATSSRFSLTRWSSHALRKTSLRSQ